MEINLKKDEEQIKRDFCALKTCQDLATLFEIPLSVLLFFAYRKPKEQQYKEYGIPKRNGKTRTIAAPISSLKIIQKKLNYILQLVHTPRSASYAFTANKNAIKNAAEHKNSRIILKIDLKDFFNQIHIGRVRGMFMAHPFNFDFKVASCLAHLCTYKMKLPQGAPTSPVISNIICWGLDKDLQKLAEAFRLKYTRYADDITFSCKRNAFPEEFVFQKGEQVIFGAILSSIFTKHRFDVNYDKIAIKRRNNRQTVTGLVINEKVNVKREYIRQIRKELFIWGKYGYEELAKKNHRPTNQNPQKDTKSYEWSLQGKLNYIKQVRGVSDTTFTSLEKWFKYLQLKDWYNDLNFSKESQKKGYDLEDIFNALFKINKIDVKEAFYRNKRAEQIDGAFVLFQSTHFLAECKWTKTKGINVEINNFQSKLSEESGQGVYGLFVSIEGWNKNTIGKLQRHSSKNIILMNGREIETIINNRSLELSDIIEWKLRKLVWEAEPFASIDQYIKEKGIKL